MNMSSSVRNLGVYFDESLSMTDHVNRLVRTCFYQLRRIRFIRRSLTAAMATTRFDHITPVLERLHWLPINSRVSFKLATLAFKTRQSNEPGYLASLLQPYQPTREFRSSSKDLLVVTTTKSRIGSRAFSRSASTTWNNLPDEVKHCDNLPSFRKNLKTFLFKAGYEHWYLRVYD